jgi:hypothetical protein
MRVHFVERFLSGLCKPEVSSRRPVPRSHRRAGHEAVGLEAGQDGVNAALAHFELLILLEGLNHLIAMTSAVFKEVQDEYVKQSFAKLGLPIVQIHVSPLFRARVILLPFTVYYIK